jgi:hypothetical protein
LEGILHADIAAVKIYDRALTQAEIVREMPFALPVSMDGINSFYPMPDGKDVTNTIVDFSTNNLSLTQSGTLTVEAGPPNLVWDNRSRFVQGNTTRQPRQAMINSATW